MAGRTLHPTVIIRFRHYLSRVVAAVDAAVDATLDAAAAVRENWGCLRKFAEISAKTAPGCKTVVWFRFVAWSRSFAPPMQSPRKRGESERINDCIENRFDEGPQVDK